MSTERWTAWAQRCENTLSHAIGSRNDIDPRLAEAMAYATLGGGKRMRPLLVYATGTALGMDEAASLLEQTLTEESETDDLLTQIADAGANKEALAEAKGGS